MKYASKLIILSYKKKTITFFWLMIVDIKTENIILIKINDLYGKKYAIEYILIIQSTLLIAITLYK